MMGPTCKTTPDPLAASRRDGLGVSFGLVSAAIVFFVRPPDLRLGDDAVAAQADEIGGARPAFVRMFLEEAREPLIQLADDVRSDRVIEHRRRANLDRAASEQEVIQRVLERRDAADTG